MSLYDRVTFALEGRNRNSPAASGQPHSKGRSTHMESSFMRAGARRALLAVGAGVLASLALAGPSFANKPAQGTACIVDPDLNGNPNDDNLNVNDSEISGRGATFANRAENALIAGYANDVCGSSPIHYNVTSPTGSGAGQGAMAFRNEAFGGSDIPYDKNT